MRILHISTEMAPFAKVGGLGDVVSGLARAVKAKGHEVEILLPKYNSIDNTYLKNLKSESESFQVEENQQKYSCTIWSAEYNGLKIWLLEANHPAHYFERKEIYGFQDDNDRFLFFCKAALEYLAKIKKQADVLHLHDWPVALVPILYKDIYKDLGMKIGKIVFTIHNLEYQGRCSIFNLTKIGFKQQRYFLEMQDPVFPGVINLLKGAIKYADALTTVSPTYEREIKTQEGGGALHSVILENEQKLKGILNGIDVEYWNPESDCFLKAHFSANDPVTKITAAKQENRAHLRKQLKLQESKGPLVISISRLVPQKSPELIKYALIETLQKEAQFVLLGSTNIKEIAQDFQNLKNQFASNHNSAIFLDYNEPFSHLLYAAADMIIIPSVFEPCGLTQMIAMRYGTIPLARRTGGLADTVFDIDTSKEPDDRRNGFTFDYLDTKGVDWVLDRALKYYQTDSKKWQRLIQNAMHTDHSWNKYAAEYLKIYQY
ncbi:MAG TPA: glycogen synthase [Rhabdochlamydiaceae bacterium]|nr:glycogen synthase [Rhabdochlamydiaceae bacterium]